MKKTFISSDHHFCHKNILKFCADTRLFDSIEEHNEQLIVRHNEVVGAEDDVYFLGDFAFTDAGMIATILDMMNGRKHFIFGNHDKPMRRPSIAEHFVWMRDYHELRMPGGSPMLPIVMHHYPIFSWNRMHHGALHFYGHTHSGIPTMFAGRGKDIGVDSNNCYPWNINDLAVLMNKCDVVDARDRQKK
jgi:calcineurin-like phosphoesterase family protein